MLNFVAICQGISITPGTSAGSPYTKNLKKFIFLQGTKVDSKLPVCASTHFWSRSGGGINKWYRQFVVFQRFFLHITVLVGTYFIALPFADLPFPRKENSILLLI